ncbi:MAG: hypothetical protein WA652_15165, partial [Xanthobacteraceae bacterium]
MQLAVARLDDRLLYALKIYDDEEKAGVLWSILALLWQIYSRCFFTPIHTRQFGHCSGLVRMMRL